jgi:hydroxymethylglutaryl-CoA reductase/dihydroflavonol-4-reductase
MSSRKILLTGATGHLGANLLRLLLAEGEDVRVMIRNTHDRTALEGLDVERVEADLRDGSAVAAAVRGCSHVYHCAALVSTIDGDAAHKRHIYDTNVRGTIHVLNAARMHAVEKVAVSGSLSATGHDAATPSHEAMPFYPFDRQLPYGFSKHLVEHECLRAHAEGLNVVVATSCAIIGPHDYAPSRMGRVLIDFAHGKLRAFIPGGFEFVSAHDIAKGHMLAMDKGRSGQKYIFSTAYSSVDDLLDIFREVTGQPLPRLRLPPDLMALMAEISDKTWFRLFPNAPRRFTPGAVRLLRMNRRVSIDKAQQELGFKPGNLSDAVRDAYQDFLYRRIIKPRKNAI